MAVPFRRLILCRLVHSQVRFHRFANVKWLMGADSKRSMYQIRQVALNPPHYNLVVEEETWEATPVSLCRAGVSCDNVNPSDRGEIISSIL